tara:strand:- start:702 stop:1007 length:306 start_codon:yes stop_codon:yes gene_type:complete
MVPLRKPYLTRAFSAYREQVGSKRQEGGKSGEIEKRYARTTKTAISFISFRGARDWKVWIPGSPVPFLIQKRGHIWPEVDIKRLKNEEDLGDNDKYYAAVV